MAIWFYLPTIGSGLFQLGTEDTTRFVYSWRYATACHVMLICSEECDLTGQDCYAVRPTVRGMHSCVMLSCGHSG